MLGEWAASGLPPEDFWIQTPRTYSAIMDAVVHRIRSERNNRVETAWRTANFMLAGSKLPPLNTFLVSIETGYALDKSPLSGTYVDAETGLDAWFNMVADLNGGK